MARSRNTLPNPQVTAGKEEEYSLLITNAIDYCIAEGPVGAATIRTLARMIAHSVCTYGTEDSDLIIDTINHWIERQYQ